MGIISSKRNPCTHDCPDRTAGCAVACPKWAEYVKIRNEDYRQRKAKHDIGDAIKAAYHRCGAKGRQV